MKQLSIILICFCCITATAQNGFYLQPEVGAGLSNACWQAFSPAGNPGQSSVFSYQGQMDIGYKAGRWQFISGIGYLRTGVKSSYNYIVDPFFMQGIAVDYNNGAFIKADYNPHIIVPVKIGYEVCRFSNRLSFTPIIGAQFGYNTPRSFVYQYNSSKGQKETESQQEFNMWCNPSAIIGLLQLNFEYRLNDRYDLTAGPSLHYMFTSEINFANEYDYSLLLNVGLKRHFKNRKPIM